MASTASTELLERFRSRALGVLRADEPLRNHGRWRIGGPADLLVEPEHVDQVCGVVELTRELGVPLVVIGDGTNVLFGDAGVRGVVMKIGRRFAGLTFDAERVTADAGVWIPGLARAAGVRAWTGLEHTCGIPSTLGGLVVMNGGSKRRGIGDVTVHVDAVDLEGRTRRLVHDDCEFERRSSRFQRNGWIVVGAELRLEPGDRGAIRREMLEILRSRRERFPLKLPNCGSVFVSGGEIYAKVGPPGLVIEQAGLKGRRQGDAQISPQHANFIVNLGNARAADVLDLIGLIRSSVHARTGIWMDCEVRYLDERGGMAPAHEALSASGGLGVPAAR